MLFGTTIKSINNNRYFNIVQLAIIIVAADGNQKHCYTLFRGRVVFIVLTRFYQLLSIHAAVKPIDSSVYVVEKKQVAMETI